MTQIKLLHPGEKWKTQILRLAGHLDVAWIYCVSMVVVMLGTLFWSQEWNDHGLSVYYKSLNVPWFPGRPIFHSFSFRSRSFHIKPSIRYNTIYPPLMWRPIAVAVVPPSCSTDLRGYLPFRAWLRKPKDSGSITSSFVWFPKSWGDLTPNHPSH